MSTRPTLSPHPLYSSWSPTWWPHRPRHPRPFLHYLTHIRTLQPKSHANVCQVYLLRVSESTFSHHRFSLTRLRTRSPTHPLLCHQSHSRTQAQPWHSQAENLGSSWDSPNSSELGQLCKDSSSFCSRKPRKENPTSASSYLCSTRHRQEGEKISKCAFAVRQISKG